MVTGCVLLVLDKGAHSWTPVAQRMQVLSFQVYCYNAWFAAVCGSFSRACSGAWVCDVDYTLEGQVCGYAFDLRFYDQQQALLGASW
mmetsp:Transcript_4865/g.8460  ORF Transcript_4865/g.8460 Transcript_4865/m.8460 type:complete len:87 (-) Transcript_4865:234-494(-)